MLELSVFALEFVIDSLPLPFPLPSPSPLLSSSSVTLKYFDASLVSPVYLILQGKTWQLDLDLVVESVLSFNTRFFPFKSSFI